MDLFTPRNHIGDRASPYTVKTVHIALEVQERVVRVDSPDDAEVVLRPIFERLDADREHMVILGLDHKNGLTGFKVVFDRHHVRVPGRSEDVVPRCPVPGRVEHHPGSQSSVRAVGAL